ncbi:pirin family protein [Lysobacter yangpyeongensis]|uniref:Pirin family protein n=1 Tax=Lysobacter yangpyeongensis TaxID=346182 RepID=A0ABW0SQW6_9GAMM
MIVDRPADSRGRGGADWLQSWHTFSFARYYDPAWMGFGPLRVINEDRVAPGAGFAPHRHANMEILSYVLEGGLAHRDDNGGGGVIRAGELQWMSAGHGIEHSEFNASDAEPVHFLQIWIQPDRLNAQPAYAQRAPVGADADGRWLLLVSPDGAEGSIAIRQDAKLYVTRLPPGAGIERTLEPQRRYWLQVTRGTVDVAGRTLGAGGAIGLVDEPGPLRIAATQPGEILLFDLP